MDTFTLQDLLEYVEKTGKSTSKDELEDYILKSDLAVPLKDGQYITRAGAFAGEIFSIKPTSYEYDSGVLIVGDRCIPFADSSIPSYKLNFFITGIQLPKKVIKIDSDSAIDKFIFYGEEYAPQYIAEDPANADNPLVSVSDEVPNFVNLTGIDISILKENFNFQKADRLICYVKNWDAGEVEITVLKDGGGHFNTDALGEKRLAWYKHVEELLLASFETLGPCPSIEDQIAELFFNNQQLLCVPECGSLEEFIFNFTKKIAIEQFGVETRLWYKGVTVPAVGSWNMSEIGDISERINNLNGKKPLFYSVPPEILNQYLLDMHFNRKDNLNELIDSIFPPKYTFHKNERELVKLNLTEIDIVFNSRYNWFTDQIAGPLRKKALHLFKKVNELIYKIDCCEADLRTFPQQELVILTQLYDHVTDILATIQTDEDVKNDSHTLELSLDGMSWSFEDIEGILLDALEEYNFNQFKILK